MNELINHFFRVFEVFKNYGKKVNLMITNLTEDFQGKKMHFALSVK